MKGLLMRPWKIKAIAESAPGFEWQTRRLSGLAEINKEPSLWQSYEVVNLPFTWHFLYADCQRHIPVKPRYLPGEVVYLKEVHYAYGKWRKSGTLTKTGKTEWEFWQCGAFGIWFDDNKPSELIISTRADGDLGWYKRSPLFLSEKDARRFVKITDVRPERLQSITPEDCEKEGYSGKYPLTIKIASPVEWYAALWDSINPDYPWDSNPWVFVYRFLKVDKDK